MMASLDNAPNFSRSPQITPLEWIVRLKLRYSLPVESMAT